MGRAWIIDATPMPLLLILFPLLFLYDDGDKRLPQDFTRDRKLPFPKLVTFILSLTASGKSKGVDIKSGDFFTDSLRNGLWPDAEAVHRSALTKARKKVSWTIAESR